MAVVAALLSASPDAPVPGNEGARAASVLELRRTALLESDNVRVHVEPSPLRRSLTVVGLSDDVSVPLTASRALPASTIAGDVTLALTGRGREALAGCQVTRIVLRADASERGGAEQALVDDGPPCGRFFSQSSFWNVPLRADAPLDPASEAVSGDLLRQVEANFSANYGPDVNSADFSTRVYTVPEGQPMVSVQVPPEKRVLNAPFTRAPLPEGARPAEGTDRHLVLYQPSRDVMWEFYDLRRTAAGWWAEWGGRMDSVSRAEGIFRPTAGNVKYGATATGLPLAGGLITPADLRRGRIDHALAIALPQTRAGTWSEPAQRTDGQDARPTAVPEGARFRLAPDVDVGSLDATPLVRMMARAAQEYGIVVRDRAGVVAFYAQVPTQGRNTILERAMAGQSASEQLRQFPWKRLQLLRMTLRRD